MSNTKKGNTAVQMDFSADSLADEIMEELKNSAPEEDALLFEDLLKEVEVGEGEDTALEGELHHFQDVSEDELIEPFEEGVEVEAEAEASAPGEVEALKDFSDENLKEEGSLKVFVPPGQEPSAVQSFSELEEVQEKTVVAVLPEQERVDEPEIEEDATIALKDLPQVDVAEQVSHLGASHSFGSRNPAIDLKNADYIKFAQDKISLLETESSRLRQECEELALAGDHFKVLSEEREQKVKVLEARLSELEETSLEEKRILNEALDSKEVRSQALQARIESLEIELESKFNRVRVRERELESRLEILKQEQEAVASSKDDMIMRLKKQVTGLQADLEKLRNQNQKSSQNLQEKEEALRRTVKALKLSLTMLESQK